MCCFLALELPGFGLFEVIYVRNSKEGRKKDIRDTRGIRQSHKEGVRSYEVVSCFKGTKERTLPRAYSLIIRLMLKLKIEVRC